ncbi:uncharacterized protein LOC141613237 [Silene latifolia]|uniref:uncharacterized protein LOC141613237 n=1 Tax=Silene latifolia TaxID=37657 RepID=UPI003D777E09
MRTYDWTSDSQNHVAIFKQKMLAASIPNELRQVCMCKGFGTTLTGEALQWFINLPNGSIKNFPDLVNAFNQQFTSSRDMAKRPSNLFRVKQLPDEPLKEFLAIFVKEKVAIPRCDEETAVEAFRQGVLLDCDIYADLTKKAWPTFATVQSIAWSMSDWKKISISEQIHPEESKAMATPTGKAPTKKETTSDQRLIPDLNGLKSMWHRNAKDIGHTTDECIQLGKHVAYLLKKGYLKDIIRQPRGKDEGTDKKDPGNNRDPPPPPPIYEVKFINEAQKSAA